MISVNLGAAFAKSLFATLGFQGMAAYRIGFAALLLMLAWRPWRAPLLRAQRLDLLGFGLALGLMNLTIYSAFARIPIGIAVAIEVTGPLLVVLWNSRTLKDLALLVLAVGGLSLLSPAALPGGAALDPLGVGFAVAAALCWALYIVFGKRVSALPNGQAVSYGMAVAAALAVPLGIFHAGSRLLVPSHLLTGLLVAILSSLLPYSLEMTALRRVPSRVFGMLVSASPAVAALSGALVLGESLTSKQWIAILCVVSASALAAATARGSEE